MSAEVWISGRGLSMEAERQSMLQLRRESVKATEAGIATASKKLDTDTGQAWLDVAINAIQRVAFDREYLSVDDVWMVLTETDREQFGPQLGIAFRKAKDRGYIEQTGGFTESQRPSRHRSPIRVWRSLLHRSSIT